MTALLFVVAIRHEQAADRPQLVGVGTATEGSPGESAGSALIVGTTAASIGIETVDPNAASPAVAKGPTVTAAADGSSPASERSGYVLGRTVYPTDLIQESPQQLHLVTTGLEAMEAECMWRKGFSQYIQRPAIPIASQTPPPLVKDEAWRRANGYGNAPDPLPGYDAGMNAFLAQLNNQQLSAAQRCSGRAVASRKASGSCIRPTDTASRRTTTPSTTQRTS